MDHLCVNLRAENMRSIPLYTVMTSVRTVSVEYRLSLHAFKGNLAFNGSVAAFNAFLPQK